MKRSLSPLIAVTLLFMGFSSCTCSSTTPEVPPTPKRAAGGFGSILPNQRTAPDVPNGEAAEAPVEAREAPTLPTAAPSQTDLPESFPADMPIYEGAEVAGVQPVPNDGQNVIFTVDSAEAPKVFDFYKDNLTNKGWKATQEYQGSEQSFLTFEKDNTTTNISITIDPKSGKRVIAVMYYEQKPLPFPEF